MYTKQTMLVLFNIMFMYWERVDIKRHNNPSQTSRKLKEKAHVCLSKNTNIYRQDITKMHKTHFVLFKTQHFLFISCLKASSPEDKMVASISHYFIMALVRK